MLVTELGEFGLIDRIKKSVKTDNSVIKGIGDDCAVLKYDKDRYQLFTSDMIVEGIDFLRNENPYLVGRKALGVSISDIAACGGIPRYCLVSLGLPLESRLKFIDRIFKGMRSLADRYGINIVGGDISRAMHLTVDVSMLGIVRKDNLVLRNGARKGDVIFVTGELGGSIKGKHLRFTPRLEEARFLAGNFKINSMIDISDSLAQDLGHILKQSRVGALIYQDLVPVSKQARNFQDALYTGEDFELLFTLSHNEASKLLAKKIKDFQAIGEIVDKKYGMRLVDRKGKEIIIQPKGFRHF